MFICFKRVKPILGRFKSFRSLGSAVTSCPFQVPRVSCWIRIQTEEQCDMCHRLPQLYTTVGLTTEHGKVYMCELGSFVTVKSKANKGHCETRNALGHLKTLFVSRWWLKLVFEYPNNSDISKSFQHQPLVHQVLKETHCVQCYLQLWKTRLCVLSEEWNLHFLASYAAYHPVFPVYHLPALVWD